MGETVRPEGERDAEQGRGPAGLPLTCRRCGNGCRAPGSTQRAYACPRCGEILPDAPRATRAVRRAPRLPVPRTDPRAALSGTILLVAAAIAIHAGLAGYRAVAASAVAVSPPPPRARITGAEARSYAFRQHQLEADLRRDASDYEVLVRLGQLHLQLAAYEGEGHGAHLRRARHFLLLAGMQAEFRSDAFLVHSLLDAANAPNPTLVLAAAPGESGPPPHDDQEWIRWRVGALEEQVQYQPRSSRLLRRLADTYAELYLALAPGSARPWHAPPEDSALSEPQMARRRAEELYQRAIACARTHEALCRALYRQAELCRMTRAPARAAVLLRQVLRVQPNNWLIALELAALDRQLGQEAAAERFETLAARWRTPRWL